MKITHYLLSSEHLPVDFKADPDDLSDYDALVKAAGFDVESGAAPAVGALTEPWFGHAEGAAVVTCPHRSLFAIVEAAERDALHHAA